MATPDNNGIPSDVRADAQAVIDHLTTGKPLDPQVARRVHERAEKITEEIRRQHGELNVGVDLIRELRGALAAKPAY